MLELKDLISISPIDGRYSEQTKELSNYFSEGALIKYRIRIEASYLIELLNFIKPEIEISDRKKERILNFWKILNFRDLIKVKEKEDILNHDIKALEYFFKDFLRSLNLENIMEFTHFGLTSEDINNISYSLMLKESLENILYPQIILIIKKLLEFSEKWSDIPMLGKTHGQPASTTTLGKEISIFLVRITDEFENLLNIKIKAKLNGATGNYNAHYLAYPNKDWIGFSENFISKLGLETNLFTTQIEPHDAFARIFDSISRINNILIDLNVDIWQYISLGYFSLAKKDDEIGSSTMPHKVNPIDFENSEGNLGLSNSLFEFMKNKLTKSRLQRDLSDSTVLRNIGVAIAHSLISYKSLLKGLNKLEPNLNIINSDLENHVEILAEGIQTILRDKNVNEPYEKLKIFTRGKNLSLLDLNNFINSLEIDKETKDKLASLKPNNYIGLSSKLTKLATKKANDFLLTLE